MIHRMSTFLTDTASTLIGTFVGFGLALTSERLLERGHRKRQRLSALQAVLNRLYHARAFRKADVPLGQRRSVLARGQDLDRDRCARSVVQTRDIIQRVLADLSVDDPARDTLERMHSACLRYLTNGARTNQVHQFAHDAAGAVVQTARRTTSPRT